ncbi:unnamed protein product [Cochlearia groenlandica]
MSKKKNNTKRENLLSPSSSWRENHNPHRKNSNSSAVSSGCLPGFFNIFLSTFNFSSNRQKSITLGSNKQKQRTVVSGGGGGDAARVSLIGALEKCDRDLEELRRTIDVIKTTYLLHKKSEVSPPAERGILKFSGTGDVIAGTQMTTRHETETNTMLSKMNHHDQDYYKDNKTHKVNNISLITKPDHDDIMTNKTTSTEITRGTTTTTPIMVRRVRLSLMDSVNQVCDDVSYGQRREVAKIGLALHDHICRDLIAEIVHELSFSKYYNRDTCRKSTVDSDVCYAGRSGSRHIRRGSTNSLPLDACRRKLVF